MSGSNAAPEGRGRRRLVVVGWDGADATLARDRSLSGLATPARVSLIVIITGLVLAGLLWLWSIAYA